MPGYYCKLELAMQVLKYKKGHCLINRYTDGVYIYIQELG